MKDYNEDYHIYRAIVYDTPTGDTGDKDSGGDDRWQVRILPFHANITKRIECAAFPRFPFLFYDHPQALKYERKYGEEADTVLVLATSDFTIGYILGGPVSTATGPRSQDVQPNSWPFQTLRDAMKEKPEELLNGVNNRYYELTVDGWSAGGDGLESGYGAGKEGGAQGNGGYVICHNRFTGDMYWLCGSGSMMALGPGYFCVHVGELGAGDSDSPYSEIFMSPTEIDIRSTDVIIDHKGILQLDESGMMVVTTPSPIPSSANGMPLIPQNSVKA